MLTAMKTIREKLNKIWWDIRNLEKSYGPWSLFAYAITLFIFQDFFAYVVLGCDLPIGEYTTLERVRDDPLRGGWIEEEFTHYVYDSHSQDLQIYAWIIAAVAALMYLILLDLLISVIRNKIDDKLYPTAFGRFFDRHVLIAAPVCSAVAVAIYFSGLMAVDDATSNVTRELRAARQIQQEEQLNDAAEKSKVQSKESPSIDIYSRNDGDTVKITECSSYILPQGAILADDKYSDPDFENRATYICDSGDCYSRYTSFVWENGTEDFPINADERIYGMAPDAEVSYESLEFDGMLTANYEKDEDYHHLFIKQCYWIDESDALCCLEIESTSEKEIAKTRHTVIGNIRNKGADPLAPF